MKSQEAGWIELVCGPMFSGKTEELIRRATQAKFAGQKVQVFKHTLDNRYHEQELVSHSGARLTAVAVPKAEVILKLIGEETVVVVIDEAHFFDPELPKVCSGLANRGMRVVVAGLDLDFRGEPFGPVPILMAQAENLTKLRSICAVCGGWATRSQRLIDGQPAPPDAPVIEVGAADIYEARCRHCHIVPGRPGGM